MVSKIFNILSNEKKTYKRNKKQSKAILSIHILFFPFKSKRNIRIPILCYHSVHKSNNYDADSLNLDLFEKHCEYINKNFTPISLKKAIRIIDGNCMQVKNPVVITFDDGYRDNFTNAYPILKKFKIPATFFLVTGFINKSIKLIDDENFAPLSWDQIKEMDGDDLIDFGAHTDTHPILSTIDSSDVVKEIVHSKKF